jgi:hypothetical protein
MSHCGASELVTNRSFIGKRQFLDDLANFSSLDKFDYELVQAAA